MTVPEVGVGLPVLDAATARTPRAFADAVRAVEAAGLDSVSVADVLVGDGTPALESITALATAAAVTERVHLDFGVLSLPTRPTAMLAAQIQSLQHLSGNRVRLGVGIGGFPGSPFWEAVGAPSTRRGALTDAALALLPGLVRGEPTVVPDRPGEPVVTLAPGAPAPPVFVGGGSAPAVFERIVAHGDAWLPSALTTAQLAADSARLRALAAAGGRPSPGVHIGLHAVLGESPSSAAEREAMYAMLSEAFGMPREQVEQVTVVGGPEQVAERLAAYAEAGATGVGLAFDGPRFERQVEVLARARDLLGRARSPRSGPDRATP
ncbi:LLM class flavin-dependent oxidoreductase [Nocardiopsis sp. CA-288880]|uniref:LLM class flavin-dependent oxidoreductase n=1 Tax=Nocardiopsis sp. CA-288880 TaxID=3239995 RepID=UPI003D95EB9B